jgi:hypothetical protein
MAIPNLLLNIDYFGNVGQSSIFQHLLTYSTDTGIFPKPATDLINNNGYIKNRETKITLGGIPDLDPDFRIFHRQENYADLIKTTLEKFDDIENEPILDSDFKFCLPASAKIGNLLDTDQTMYFVKQPRSYYIFDSNLRTRNWEMSMIDPQYFFKFKKIFNLPDANSLEHLINILGEEISPKNPSLGVDWLQDKPVALISKARNKGLEYAIEQGEDEFKKVFLDIPEYDEKDLSSIKHITFDIENLFSTTKTTSTDYYKYICDTLKIASNDVLFNELYDNLLIKNDYERLKTLTKSNYLTKILCNENEN